MDPFELGRAAAALLAVLALLGLLAGAARWFGLHRRLGAPAGARLAVVEQRWLDPRTRLVLVRRDRVEHLLLLGAGPPALIEAAIAPPPAAEPGPSSRSLPGALVFALASILLAAPAAAQSLSVDLGSGGSFTGQIVKLLLLMTVLSLAPSILVMVTSFVRIVIVLSLLRTAIGLQQSPPNPVLVSLALFLTLFVMAPTFETAWRDGIAPLVEEELEETVALERAAAPFHEFMRRQVREKDVALFLDIARLEPPAAAEDLPFRVLVPAFMISELRRAFEIGFVVFVPFLVIDLVVACLLMAMGMMMLPPVMISLPFKLVFFVLVDGWSLVVGGLVESFASG